MSHLVISRNTTDRCVAAFRERIAYFCETELLAKDEPRLTQAASTYVAPGELDCQKHFRAGYGSDELANKHSRIDGIESSWTFSKCGPRFRAWQHNLVPSI